MFEPIRHLFDTGDFPARWECGAWSEAHGWTHIGADLLIFGAYAAIPTAIGWYAFRRRSDIAFPRLYWLFAAFIFACGLGHLVESTLFWQPWYRFSAAVKVFTAVVSWAAVIALLRFVPQALSLPNAARLNVQLQREITERRNAEARINELNQELAMKVQELEKLLEILPVGIGIALDRECRTIRTNRAFSEMLGIGRTDNASLSAAPGEAPAGFSVWQDGRKLTPSELPIQRAAYSGKEVRNFEELVVRADGTHVDLLCDAAPIFDANRECRGAVGVFHEITERKRAEQRFRAVVEASPSALFVADESGQIQLVNSQAERLFGYSRSELLTKKLDQVIPPPPPGETSAAEVTVSGAGSRREAIGVTREGGEVPVEITINPLEIGEAQYSLASVVDITARKHAEERTLASLREKQALLHEIHHRVKNNLQFIISLLRLQAVELSDPKLAEALEETRTRVHAMALVHERMYRADDFSRLDYASYLRELLAALARGMSQRVARVNLTVQADPVGLGTNAAVPVGFIVNELVSNSLKHGFPDGAAGKVEVFLHGNPEAGYDLVVRDNGRGSPSDFDPTTTQSMGWRLISMLVRQLGGTMKMDRSNGTEFAIHFTPRQNA